jgi:hypothetical protein
LPLFWGGNPEIPKFPKFPKIPENPGEISGDFDEKKINLPAVFSFPPLSEIREIPGENSGKISGKFREILEIFGNFSPGDIFQNSRNWGENLTEKEQFIGYSFRFTPFLSPMSRRFPENPGKLILTNLDNFRKFFSAGATFRKIPGKISGNFMYKKYNLPAVNKCLHNFIPDCPGGFRKPPGNFSGNFLSRGEFVPIEIIRSLHLQKIQIYGCKQVFFF